MKPPGDSGQVASSRRERRSDWGGRMGRSGSRGYAAKRGSGEKKGISGTPDILGISPILGSNFALKPASEQARVSTAASR